MLSGTETKVQFWYRSQIFFSETETSFKFSNSSFSPVSNFSVGYIFFKLEKKPKKFKVWQQSWFQGPFYDRTNTPYRSQIIGNQILPLKCGFGISYNIGQRHQPGHLGFGIRPKTKYRHSSISAIFDLPRFIILSYFPPLQYY